MGNIEQQNNGAILSILGEMTDKQRKVMEIANKFLDKGITPQEIIEFERATIFRHVEIMRKKRLIFGSDEVQLNDLEIEFVEDRCNKYKVPEGQGIRNSVLFIIDDYKKQFK